tara:strand:+ start:126837 stop:127859 length:1023 start_codon:yes stop_codon:yes gene_type:complete
VILSGSDKKGFHYQKTDFVVRSSWADGEWSPLELHGDDTLHIPLAATALHYGQSAFEGLKAFRQPNCSVSVFRPLENAKRLRTSCERICMAQVDDQMFLEAIDLAVKNNWEHIPPAEDGSALYIRPFIFGSGPTIGVRPSDNYEFVIMVIPVGSYYDPKSQGATAYIAENYDRAAPKGMGHVKAAGNYAAGLLPTKLAKSNGFDMVLYLDAKTRQNVEEFGTSNFIALTEDGKYITPDSGTILPSITNDSLIQICKDKGITVERRAISVKEISSLKEIGACGTAVGITPLNEIYRGEELAWKSKVPVAESQLMELLKDLQGIQRGQSTDPHGWRHNISAP